MSTLLIKNGTLVTPESSRPADILLRDGVVESVTPCGEGSVTVCADEVYDADGCIVCCALADAHVHFRVPGNPEKEDIASGSAAAAHGGYTSVCAMPNLTPAPDSVQTIALEQELIDRDAVIDVHPYATITMGRKGSELVDMESLKGACVAFSDDGSGIQKEDVMRAAMTEAARLDCIIAAHCEDNSLLKGGYIHDGRYAAEHGHRGICSESEWGQIARDLVLAEQTGCRYHVCHISTKESVDVIRKAKARGVKVTCETGPHYLTMTDADLQEEGRFKMNPPLRSFEDRAALIEGIQDGTIDMVATDHAPHTAEQKSRGLEHSAMGVVGLETAFPVLYTRLVKENVISIEKLVALMSEAPRRIFGLGGCLEVGKPAELAVFNTKDLYQIDSEDFVSKGKASPFEGWAVYGKCVLTIHDGKIVHKA